ncbi:MAG TPA: hypothetical protein VF605_11655 [Allosphingosinicella sp.]|jgi:putative chitinase
MDSGDTKPAVTAGPPPTADPQDPLPESNWLYRRILIFAGVASCAIGLGIIIAIFHGIATRALASADSANGAQITLHAIEALYNLGFWLVIIVLVNLTLYLIAPSAEQATKMLATVQALKGGVTFASRSAIATPTARAETASIAGVGAEAPKAAPVAAPAPAAAAEPVPVPGTAPAPAEAAPAALVVSEPAPAREVTTGVPAAAPAHALAMIAAPVGPVPRVVELLSVEVLKAGCPETPIEKLALWLPAIKDACHRYEINTVRRVAAFVAQMAHESQGFTKSGENLNYTTAARLRAVFPKYFRTLDAAKPCLRSPEKLANRVYASRMGNGNEASGDGYRFRGGGPLQLTGRNNWTGFAKAMGLSVEAALSYGRTIAGGVMAAAWFWESNDLNRLADTPGVADESKRVNGGTNGLEDRKRRFDALVAKLLAVGAWPMIFRPIRLTEGAFK